ncbi:MAG: hypothetical protein IKB42_04930 [Clostridia bacterium]|nr:hypothetical protein [Clostridia bacterium]
MEYKYCYGIGIKKLSNPTKFLKSHSLFCGDSIKYCGISEKHFTNDFNEVLDFFSAENLQSINLNRVDKEDVSKLFKAICDRVVSIDLIYCDCEYSLIEEFVNVKNIEVLHTTQPFKIWNVSKNSCLKNLSLVFHNTRIIDGVENLKNSSIERLVIDTCNAVPSRYIPVQIGSLKVLGDIPGLKSVQVYVVSQNDKVEELLALSKMKDIEEIKLQKGHFTFEQFAWLKSKLEHIKDFGCLYLYKFDDYYDCEAGVIIGKNKPNYYLDKSGTGLDRYIKKYNMLVDKYKSVDIPPDNFR